MRKEYTFKILRYDPEKDRKPHYQSFPVPYQEGMTILDGLFYIQYNLDGTLAFRNVCRAGVCGSCSMHINGRYRLACETQVSHVSRGSVVLRPMANLPITKDLITDMTKFWYKYRYIQPWLIAGKPAQENAEYTQSPDERANLDLIIDCTLCGICTQSCSVTATDEEYLGPAALLKAERFIADSRDSADFERLDLIDTEHGLWKCHTIYNCQLLCPKKINPTGSIKSLQRRMVHRYMAYNEPSGRD